MMVDVSGRRNIAAMLGVALIGLLAAGLAVSAASVSRATDRGLNHASVTTADTMSTSGLHVVGGTLQNWAGQVVRLHGVNRSSWQYTCLDGSGQTHDGSADQAEVNAMLAWHINAVRVVLNEDCWL